MLHGTCPCDGCSNQVRCGLRDLGRGLPGAPALDIRIEEYRADSEIPAVGGCLLAVKSGAVKTLCQDAQGQSHVVGFSFPGELIALEALADAEPAGVSYKTSVSMTAVCRIRVHPETARQASAQFCQRLNAEMASRIRANFHHRQIVADGAEVRLAHYLVALVRAGQRQGRPVSATLPSIARADIASYLHLRAETVSRTLAAFRQNGWVRGPLHRLEVVDLAALTALTHGLAAA
jgi:CRP/FNR family transcriptional regulator